MEVLLGKSLISIVHVPASHVWWHQRVFMNLHKFRKIAAILGLERVCWVLNHGRIGRWEAKGLMNQLWSIHVFTPCNTKPFFILFPFFMSRKRDSCIHSCVSYVIMSQFHQFFASYSWISMNHNPIDPVTSFQAIHARHGSSQLIHPGKLRRTKRPPWLFVADPTALWSTYTLW